MSASIRIQSLPLHLANQIAAGEVIERPASVVKELVENSLDAGATQVYIDIEGAGSQLIRVSDNGAGIHPDDLSLALSRHATSKLHSTEQLTHIASLGFRGEALPSIASISELTLSSRQQNSDCGWQISIDKENNTPVSHPIGTTVEVRDLFFNVPARRRFLRGDKTEQLHINTTLNRLALSQFEIGFQWQLSATSHIKLPAAITPEQQQQRIAKICGKTFINNCIYIQQQFDEINLSGWLGKAEAHRPQTDVNYFFINGRVIRDRVINHAIRQAYSDLIPTGRYPAFVLYLTLPLDRVDINVHPTKHEVRFRDARLIHGLITRALQDALGSRQSSPNNVPTDQSANKPLAHHIAEDAGDYQQKDEPTLANINNINSSAQLLHQRYLITQLAGESLLFDLQQAEHSLRLQQLQHAIATNSLSSRPILVPIKIMLEQSQQQIMIENQTELTALGITFQANDDHLLIKSIPSLLAQVDIAPLISTIACYLSDKTISNHSLNLILEQQLPMLPILNLQQAETIVRQLSSINISDKWCRQLDHKTLSSLF
ncbi:MAG: DNA mismatch repair endonuclease MutL [Piscirickettsiaceae bacterium]|nr:DNA mismatch repair endonuclease MutL [Piscirickettsiaceae bacterium]